MASKGGPQEDGAKKTKNLRNRRTAYKIRTVGAIPHPDQQEGGIIRGNETIEEENRDGTHGM